jgi:hypothetical protein
MQVVPAWLGCLPLKGDLVEAKIVHEQLCSMVERYVQKGLFSVLADIVLDFQMFVLMGILALVAVGLKVVSLAN